MNKLLIFIILIVTASNVSAQSIQTISSEIAHNLKDGKIGKVYKTFSKKTKKKFKKIFLVAAWKSIEKNNGSITRIGQASFSKIKGNETATIPIEFEKSTLNLVLVTNENLEVVSLTFNPLAYETPTWAANQVFGKERIEIKTDTFKLPGELLLPESCEQCPVVILVHGSGPNDMDEGNPASSNKLFRDLAYGFALNGIATIRYDKRTLTYQKQLAKSDSITLYDETIYDALSAVRLSKTYGFLDTNRVYVLGHSLGAYASPLIVESDATIKGIILLAGPYRPVYELIPEQYAYIFGLDGVLSKKESKLINQATEEVKLINNQPSEATRLQVLGNDKLLFYFQQMTAYDPASTISTLHCRVLIAQGNRDYQVRHETEFETYRSKLSDNENVDFYLIEGANHQLIWGNEASTPSEYFKPGHPDEMVIKKISDWILEK